MPLIRTRQDIDELLGGPTPAEVKLMLACQAGEQCTLGNGSLPTGHFPHPERHIRADILRYLILGGCMTCKVAEVGIWLRGAYVTEELLINYTELNGALSLRDSRFTSAIKSQHTTCSFINLSGSSLTEWWAPELNVHGSVLLRRIVASGPIRLNNSRIRGKLALEGAQLTPTCGDALKAHSSAIEGGVFLHPLSDKAKLDYPIAFRANGKVNFNQSTLGSFCAEDVTIRQLENQSALVLNNVHVRGDVSLSGISVTGEVEFAGSEIKGSLKCEKGTFRNRNGHAFNGQRMIVGQAFTWKKDVSCEIGAISLNNAEVAVLDDDLNDWPKEQDRLLLDGFGYKRIRGTVSTSPERLEWLQNGSIYQGQFFPQPYTQYAKFLRETGHDAQARRVLLKREIEVRKYERKELNPFLRSWRYLWDGLQLVVVGHGHAPFWSIGWLVLLIVLATIPANRTWKEGSFAPNSAPVLVSYDWKKYERTEQKPALVWSGEQPPDGWEKPDDDTQWKDVAPGRDWETFNRYAYAADIVIPIIDFGQTDAWAPSTTRQEAGQRFWWTRWIFTVLGWIVTALGAAAITGIIRRE